MKGLVLGVALLVACAQGVSAQDRPREEQVLIDLSATKWRWMSERNVDSLAALFHEKARFVHMSGTWGTDAEIDIIRSGRIHYRQADVHDVVVELFDDTAILWNRITLLAVVGGNEVTTEFTVTEVYQEHDARWKLLALTFSSVRDTHRLEH